jgi:hypothetical protein
MGANTSKFKYSDNDYQLVIESSKELEYVLEKEFQAEGRGLHEKLSSIEHKLPASTIKSIRYIASVRNALIHDRNVRKLDNRDMFISKFDLAMTELQVVIDKQHSTETNQGGFVNVLKSFFL